MPTQRRVAVLSRPSALANQMTELLSSVWRQEHVDFTLTSFDLLREVDNPALEDCSAILLMCTSNVEAVYSTTVALDTLSRRFDQSRVTVVVMQQRGTDADAVARQLSRRASRVQVIPFDAHLSSLDKATLADLQPATKSAYTQLAANIIDQIAMPRLFAAR